MESQKRILLYQTEEGRIPFLEWRDKLRDTRARARIADRLNRFTLGLMGDVKLVGEGIHEARIDEGPGYRLYFLNDKDCVIVLLCAGNKATQSRDIRKAKRYAEDYRRKPKNES